VICIFNRNLSRNDDFFAGKSDTFNVLRVFFSGKILRLRVFNLIISEWTLPPTVLFFSKTSLFINKYGLLLFPCVIVLKHSDIIRYLLMMAFMLVLRTLPETAALTRSLHATPLVSRTHLPELPKQPKNPFFKFLEVEKANILATHKDAKTVELARLAGQRWRELPEETKQAFKDDFQAELAAWKEKKSAVEAHLQKANLLDEVKAKIEEEKLEKAIRKAKRKQKELATELGRPQRPASSYGYE